MAKKTETEEIGTIYTFYANEVGNKAEIATKGSTLALNSHNTKMGRRWFIQGDRGLVLWAASAPDTLELCEKWLDLNGWKKQGDMPPDVFEYEQS